jgi:hypothetical protein
VQVICFAVGFLLPVTWFVGAVLPLPPRPESYPDIEKNHWERIHAEGAGGHGHHSTDHPQHYSYYGQAVLDEENDGISRLKAEKLVRGNEEVMWQNIRWWRTLNRWMSSVGALVLVLVIVLAVVGTRRWAK